MAQILAPKNGRGSAQDKLGPTRVHFLEAVLDQKSVQKGPIFWRRLSGKIGKKSQKLHFAIFCGFYRSRATKNWHFLVTQKMTIFVPKMDIFALRGR